MRTTLPGRPPAKLQALSVALWDGIRIIAYVSGSAVAILNNAHRLLQTIYIDEAEDLESIVIDEASGKIAVCGGPDIWVYQPYRIGDTHKWSLAHSFRSGNDDDDDPHIKTVSWGSYEELLAGSSHLRLWNPADTSRPIWSAQVANTVKFAQFSHDGELIASTGQYDRLVKVWRRQNFGTENVVFDNSYLPHPATVTSIHWRRPHHREQSMENILYTICADNKIRVWAPMDKHAVATPLQLWTEIDMVSSIQPRNPTSSSQNERRFGFIIDSRDFSVATEHAVQHGNSQNGKDHALEHLIEVATKSPEICIVLDGKGHMSAWGLDNVGSRVTSESSVFNVTHIENLNISFDPDAWPHENYARFYCFAGGVSEASFTILTHSFDGKIEWFDTKLDLLFDPAPRKKRLTSRAVWSGHMGPVKKIVRTPTGKVLSSRTDDNKAVIWRQKARSVGSVLVRQSTLLSDQHIHRTCLIGDGKYLVNLHHSGISLWDIRSSHAKQLDACNFQLNSKPLCILLIPNAEDSSATEYVATIGANTSGIVWEVDLPEERAHYKSKSHTAHGGTLRQFATFHLGLEEDLSYILPVDPAGSQMKISGFLDLFATDIALSYTHRGVVRTWTAKVDKSAGKVDWLLTSTVDTGIVNPSLASAGSIRKTAIVNQDRSHLTIWDMNGAHLEFEEHFSQEDIIRDLDWTSTPDVQSILAVGFPRKVILLSQLRYDYLDAGPSWGKIREIRIQDYTPHPIGDSCWLGDGHLVVGAGNQLFVYDKLVETSSKVVAGLRMPGSKKPYVDLFDVVSRLNGPLPVFHPQFLSQCIITGRTNLVHLILTTLYRQLKFFTEGDELDSFLDIPLDDIYKQTDTQQRISWKEMNSSYANFPLDDESSVMDETAASALNEHLTRFAISQLSSREQFRLMDIVECVATVDKHRQSMDDNAARYLLFFRQHMLRRSQGAPEEPIISWREMVWAFHSESHEILTDLVSRQYHGRMTWENARECGVFMWITDVDALRAQLEIVARNEYTKTDDKNPVDCSLFYLALGKKNVLQGLWRMANWHREQAATRRLLSNNFKDPRWQSSALKNAYALLGRRRFEYAAAFFLLADHLRDAVNICMNQLRDMQLAVTIARAYEGDDGPVLQEVLEDRILPEASSTGNRWMATWAFWMLNRRDRAVRTLVTPIESLVTSTPTSPNSLGSTILRAKSYLSNDPALVVLYTQLREKTLQTLKGASKIPARDEWDFVLRNARLYDRMGCDLLALNLVSGWDFLRTPTPTTKDLPTRLPEGLMEEAPDPKKLLRRRSSLVVADMPLRPKLHEDVQNGTAADGKPVSTSGHQDPKGFQEPDSSSLLDNFGF